MQEALRQTFGDLGAIVVQFVLTVVIVLAAIAVVYWLVRRYSGIRLGGIGRGRVPRLAVVDAMAVDSRRQLVLIRRDNVEHLILIGGPADIVVEPSIQRPRVRPAQQPGQAAASPEAAARAATPPPQPAAAMPAPAPAESAQPAVANEPIPFPPPRPQRPASGERPPLRAVMRPPPPPPEPLPPPPAARAEPEPAPWLAAQDVTAAFRPPVAEAPASVEPFLPAIVEGEAVEAEPAMPAPTMPDVAMAEDEADEMRQPALDLGEGGAPATDPAEPQGAPEAETASRVSDLEREMARLLGEITAKRSN